MSFHLDYLLDLPGITVETCSYVENHVCLQLRILSEGITCPHCQHYTEEMHQNRPILVRDLPTFGRAVYLRVPRRQFYCSNCQHYTTETLEFVDWLRRHTQRYEENIYQRIRCSSIEQVSREEQLSVEEIKGIFDHISHPQKKEWGSVKCLSIDEISMRKGHRDFVTVVSDIERGELLEVMDTHKQEEIIETLKQQSLEVRESVEQGARRYVGWIPQSHCRSFPSGGGSL